MNNHKQIKLEKFPRVTFQMSRGDWKTIGQHDPVVAINSAYSDTPFLNGEKSHSLWFTFSNGKSIPIQAFRSSLDRDLAMFQIMAWVAKSGDEIRLPFKMYFEEMALNTRHNRVLETVKFSEITIVEKVLTTLYDQKSLLNQYNSSPHWNVELDKSTISALLKNKKPSTFKFEQIQQLSFSMMAMTTPKNGEGNLTPTFSWIEGIPNSLLLKHAGKNLYR